MDTNELISRVKKNESLVKLKLTVEKKLAEIEAREMSTTDEPKKVTIASQVTQPKKDSRGSQVKDSNVLGFANEQTQTGGGEKKKSSDKVESLSPNHFHATNVHLGPIPSTVYFLRTPESPTSQDSGTHVKQQTGKSGKNKKNTSISVKPIDLYRPRKGSLGVSGVSRYIHRKFQTGQSDGYPEDYEGPFDGEDRDSENDESRQKRMLSQVRAVGQVNASTMARPIGYRELKLISKKDAEPASYKDAETQVDPTDIEKTTALLRGIILDPYNVLWPSTGDFSILKAERAIEDYVTRCWTVCSQWYFHIEFLQTVVGCYRNKYIFEVKWSMPTAENPIPVATASVYFIFDVETYGGRDETVKIHYVLEGSRYPHVPGEIPFQQKWLSQVICEKMRLQKSVCI